MIDHTNEQLYPLSIVIRERWIPPGRGGKSLHYSTLVRWILKGLRGPNGEWIKLEATRVGHRWCISRGAMQRFLDALTAVHLPDEQEQPQTPRSPTQRLRSSKVAAAELIRRGL